MITNIYIVSRISIVPMVDFAVILWPIWFTITVINVVIYMTTKKSFIALFVIDIALYVTALVFTVKAEIERREAEKRGLGTSGILAIILSIAAFALGSVVVIADSLTSA